MEYGYRFPPGLVNKISIRIIGLRQSGGLRFFKGLI
jgi:hypothetical protein